MTMFGAALHISMISVCLLSAAYLYLYLIPSIGAGINNKCLGSMRCSRYLEWVKVGGVDTAFAYRVDGADRQWRGFRSALGLLIVVSASVSGALGLIRRKMLAGLRDEVRWVLALRLVVGAVIVIVYHGYHALIVFTIALMGYLVSSLSLHDQSRQVMYTWVFAVVVMLFKESYRLRDRCPLLVPLFDSRRYGGMYEWQYPANFLVLRMVSFSLDRCWATYGRRSSSSSSQEGSQSSLLLHGVSCSRSTSTSSAEEAESASLDMHDYGLLQYLSYALYSPLYIAGPVCSFNAYMTYSRHPQLQERVAAYAVRWAACCLLMEFLTSQFFFFAVISAHLTHLLDPFEVAVLCYVTLKLMWLKFLIIWRAFRLWALLDGVNSPENMLKCMSNNHSLEQFWRGWHSSFNRWIVRYLYRPLGGRVRNNVFNATIVFLFVSAWHDIEPKLLAWGLLNAAFYALEVTAKRWYSALQQAQGAIPSAVHHFVTITAGALYIIVLIGVNLVGYSVGIDGASAMLGRFYSADGCRALCCSFYFLCIGVILMRYIEEGYKQQQRQQSLKVE